MITETDEVRAALESARRRWPKDSPSQLLQRLIAHGHSAIGDRVERRRAAIQATSGVATGSYGPGYLDELRGDWDE
jgi:hypothetical protein